MIRGLVDTDDLPGSLARIMGSEAGFREPIAQQLALIVDILVGGSVPDVPFGKESWVSEAPLDGQTYGRQNAAWSAISGFGPWTACSYPPGCSGSLQARMVGDPQIATIELIGQASSTSQWDSTYTFILARMPPGMAPSADRFVLVPSSFTPGTPDSVSCAWFKPTGDIAIAFIYEKGQNPLIAWFGGVTIQI